MGTFSRLLSEVYVFAKGLFRYKGVLFWLIIFPLLFYGLMVGIWGNPQANPVRVGVYNMDKSVSYNNSEINFGRILVKSMNESGLFKVKLYDNETKLLYDVKHGKIDAGVIIPENFSENIVTLHTPEVKVVTLKTTWGSYYQGVTEGFISGFADRLRSYFLNTSLHYAIHNVPSNMTDFIVRWFKFMEKPIKVNNITYSPPLLATREGIAAYYAVSVIGIEVLFVGLSTGATAILDLKRDNTIKVILSSPMRKWEVFTAQMLSVLTGIAVSALTILVFSLLIGAKYYMSTGVALTTILLLLLSALFTIGLGLLIAALARTYEAAMAIVNMIAFPVMFIGGIAIPSFLLPQTLQKFAKAFPLSQTIEAIRGMLTYGLKPTQALEASSTAIIATFVVYALGALIFRKLLARAAEE